jgi:DNA-binding transcriptional LysR family regulator
MDLDLNLLLALDALLSESHVTRAARAVGLSQSAMSHALARLREKLDDPLLVRTPRGMEQTARARALAAPLRAALLELDRAIAPASPFDPGRARHTFLLGVSDYEELTLVRPLLRRLAQEAPGIDLVLRPSPPTQWEVMLARGELDLVSRPAPVSDAPEGSYFQRLLVKDRFVVVARKGNPHTAGRLTLRRYVEAPHALVAPGGTPRGLVDDLLAERGLARRIAVSVPHFLVAPHFVAESDLLLTLAERVARTYAPLLDLELHPLPLSLPGFAIHAVWHARLQHDPAQRYLRELLFQVARSPR